VAAAAAALDYHVLRVDDAVVGEARTAAPAHLRAVLAARLALESSPGGQAGQPWWRSERRIRAAVGGRVGGGHIPDAEACWAEIPGSPYPPGSRGRCNTLTFEQEVKCYGSTSETSLLYSG